MPEYYDLPPLNTDAAEVGSRDWDILQWCETRLKRGVEFLEGQVGYQRISETLDEMFSNEMRSGVSWAPVGKMGSRTRANIISKIAEDITANLTDVRYFWKYHTDNQALERQTEISNKSGERWYEDNNIALRIGDVIRDYTVCGTGVAHMYYSRQIDDIFLEAEDPRNVYPIDPMSYHGFEDCLGVILRRPRTPEWVKEEYNKVVRADTSVIGRFFGWMKSNIIQGPGERSGPLSKKSRGDMQIPGTPTVYVNTMYLKDSRVNKQSGIVRLGSWVDGKPDSPWSYEVKPGQPLFPFRRLIVWGGGAILYDGPAPYWHAHFPVIKLTLNPWRGSWFGKAPLWDCLPLQRSINSNLCVIDDHAAQVAQPGVIGDRNVSKSQMDKINTRAAGLKIRTNMSSGKGVQIVNPPPLDSVIWESIKWCQEMMQQLSGTADVSAMSQLAQIPSDDTIDTIMKAMTPGLRLRSRILEGFYKQVAYQYLFNHWEWDTTTKRIAMFGPQALLKEDFDFAPGNGIPDDIPDGDVGDVAAQENAIITDSPRPLYKRAQAMILAISCKFDPSSLLNSAAQQELMKYFMLAKMGYISVFTLMEKMGIMNYCPPNLKVPPDEVSRLQLQQTLGIGMIANAQGRKSTDSAPPSMGQNANGPTIQTS